MLKHVALLAAEAEIRRAELTKHKMTTAHRMGISIKLEEES